MKSMMKSLLREEGQDLIEYTLLIAFIALASAAIYVNAGTGVDSIWRTAGSQTSSSVPAARS